MGRRCIGRTWMRQKRRNYNVSQGNWVLDIFKYMGGGLLAVLAVFALCVLLIEVAIPYVPFEAEQKLFSLVGSGNPFPGERLPGREAALKAMYDQLPADCIKPEHPVIFEVIESDMVNAFALPGGRIVVMSGLLDRMQSENELMFVIGHEMGHIINKDNLRSFSRGMLVSGILAAVEKATGISLLSDPLDLANLAFNRERETQADRIGVEVLRSRYGHVGGADGFFNVLNEMGDEPGWAAYFSTHPDTGKRIQAIQRYSEDHGYVAGETTPMPVMLQSAEARI